MSGSRAIAAAINRRTNAPNAAVSNARPGRGGQQQQQQGRKIQPPQQEKVYPKLSVSDAIALTTIRLGRVESFINALPPLEQIGRHSSAGGDNHIAYDDNIKIVDEAVFKSIVTRLDKLESKIEERFSVFETRLQAKIEEMAAANVIETDASINETEDIKKKMVLDSIE